MLPLILILSGLGGGILSCSKDATTGSGPLSATQLYWALQLNQHAVNLALTAPYNTVQLTATPLNAAGTALAGLGPVTYRATDSTVIVSPTGLVTAHTLTSQTTVIATLQDTLEHLTHTDSVYLQVTNTPPPHALLTFSLQPVLGDSAKRAVDAVVPNLLNNYNPTFHWSVNATDVMGQTVCDSSACPLLIAYASSNPLIATIDAHGHVTLVDTGHVKFTATTLAYGSIESDSVVFTIGPKIHVNIMTTISQVSNLTRLTWGIPSKIIIGVGATVTFINASLTDSLDIQFDHQNGVDTASTVDAVNPFFGPFVTYPPTGGGNIASFVCDNAAPGTTVPECLADGTELRARHFSAAGTYKFHSSRFPIDTVQITVQGM